MTYKQIFLINNDLGMKAGKIAVQVAHGEILYMESMPDEYISGSIEEKRIEKYMKWRCYDTKPIGTMTKVVLKASEKEIGEILMYLAVEHILSYTVFDMGITQVKKGSLTCVCTEPLEESVADRLFGHLKLL